MNKHIPIHYFSNVPNNEEGAEFIRLARKFLNRKRYKLRIMGRGTRKVNGAKNSYRYSASLPLKFSERFSLYIDDFISRYEMMDLKLEAWNKGEKIDRITKHLLSALGEVEEDRS
jgi:hypothetical protein|tara:strand:- start:554 stop:898 length:345 start_codon:yes stop_codon:yes gene_type:complete